ncbi:MAG TPA: hypothetical protein VF585_07160 [Chthoniobacterales bacterium]
MICLLCWALVVASGMGLMMRYELQPGRQTAASNQWPAGAPLSLDPKSANLLVFAHPRCPCTRATITELEQVVRRCKDQVRVTVFFYQPHDAGPEWQQASLWKQATQIPGVTVRSDVEGAVSKQFGAETSGQTLLFNGRGEQVFAGGITGARGRVGANAGESALVAGILHRVAAKKNTPVFGCSLLAMASGLEWESL